MIPVLLTLALQEAWHPGAVFFRYPWYKLIGRSGVFFAFSCTEAAASDHLASDKNDM